MYEDGCLLGYCTSKTSSDFYQATGRYNPEDSRVHSHRRENLNFHIARSSGPGVKTVQGEFGTSLEQFQLLSLC
jgi:hypothetical protein